MSFVSHVRSSNVAFVAVLTLVVAMTAHPAQAQDPPFNRGISDACSSEARSFDPFYDTSSGTHYEATNCIAYFGITTGLTDGDGISYYAPRDSVTRAQMASFIARMLDRVDDYGLPGDPGSVFPDVSGTHASAVNRLANVGIVEGRADGTYGPDRAVSREQMASYIARAIEAVTGESLPRADVFDDRPASAHESNVQKLAAVGVVEGRGGGIYGPRRDVSRREMASFLARGLDYLAAVGFGSTPETPNFPREISSFTTELTPGQDRNHNIHLAADYLDGATISPGETFSLNQGIGQRTSARGFISNGFIDADGELISVVGGGVSQMGTTFFNAAWFAGIDLVEHHPHSLYFERYPPGREATIAWGTLDVRVHNDSPHPITVSTSYTSSSVTVTFVGTPWAEVTDSWIDAPAGVSTGDSFYVTYGRTVTYPDGSTSSDWFEHTYEPMN